MNIIEIIILITHFCKRLHYFNMEEYVLKLKNKLDVYILKHNQLIQVLCEERIKQLHVNERNRSFQNDLLIEVQSISKRMSEIEPKVQEGKWHEELCDETMRIHGERLDSHEEGYEELLQVLEKERDLVEGKMKMNNSRIEYLERKLTEMFAI